MTSAADIAEALRWLSPDCEREQWVRILMAVKAALGDEGRAIAEAWSQGSDRYRADAFRGTWRSIRADGGIGTGTLFALAREAGYRPEGPPPARPPLRPAERVQRAQPENRTQHLARELWARADRDDAAVAAHPYAIRKRITHAAGAGRTIASGRVVGQNADCIVVPLRTLDAELVGVEIIGAEGAKQTFGRKGVLVLGNDLDPTLPTFVVEGWATAVHTLNAYDWNACAVFAGGKGRLNQVAGELERRHPGREIIVCKEADQ
jgi:putative DNA primase/helicase